MPTETARESACSALPLGRNAVIVVLLILLAITTTGWVVTATRDRPLYVTAPAAAQEPARQPAPLPPITQAPVEPVAREMVEVVVAAKDLPVGTMFTRDELKSFVKLKKVPKDGLPPAYVTNLEDLLDKRVSRPVRVEETFNPRDVVKGGLITLPEGYDMVSIPIDVSKAAGGFVGPGSRVNVIATMRLNNKVYAFPLLVNLLVVAVDTQTTYTKEGTFPGLSTVSFAVTQKQALTLSLAKSRGCNLELLLRHPNKNGEGDRDHDIDTVIKLLSQEQGNPAPAEGPEAPPKERPALEVAPAPRAVGER